MGRYHNIHKADRPILSAEMKARNRLLEVSSKVETRKVKPVEAVQLGIALEKAQTMRPADLTREDAELLLKNGVTPGDISKAYGFKHGSILKRLEIFGLCVNGNITVAVEKGDTPTMAADDSHQEGASVVPDGGVIVPEGDAIVPPQGVTEPGEGVIVPPEGAIAPVETSMTPVEAIKAGLWFDQARAMTPADLTLEDAKFLFAQRGVTKQAVKRAYGFTSDAAFYKELKELGIHTPKEKAKPCREIKGKSEPIKQPAQEKHEDKPAMKFKPKQIFVCPMCNSTYGDAEEAQRCIESHVLPAEIVNVKGYDQAEEINAPTDIYVKLSDGRTAVYHLDSVIFEVPAC